MSAMDCPYTLSCDYTLFGDCASMVEEGCGRCWMCGDLAIPCNRKIPEEYLGDNGEKPCVSCLKKMTEDDYKEEA